MCQCLAHINLCSMEQAVVLNLYAKITKWKLKVKILHDLKEF